ncbi:hypothetical protein SAMN05216470_2016 [Streptococcus equinus]|uniref:Uncharacterized protein n=1 Tax=Streptococcus equinus TaxID=1335 RepID=A0A239RG32_STREI|nr:hypothetical protein [Streptococcus equinus]SNU09789.1 hypothetical protein SAMN05216470_2016 [Streptococcus equinus]
MKLNETTLADVLHTMAEDKADYAEVDFEINGLKARLEIKLVSRDEDEE